LRRSCFASLAVVCASAALAAPADAYVPHTIQSGESLWSIARQDGLSLSALAAANGLSSVSQLRRGGVVVIPSASGVGVAASDDGGADGAPEVVSSTAITRRVGPPAPPLGGYVVRRGDTLSGIAARSRVTAGQIAFMNGLSLRSPLRVGTELKLPTGAPVSSSAPVPARRVIPLAAPTPSPSRVTGSEITPIATRNGVPASLVKAIAWQESGFNNAAVSSANARGVMQLLPGTWTWVQQNLAARRLNPNSALDNVAAGTLYLGSLLRSTRGNPTLAAASYYQGLGSVQRNGLLPETRRYVNSVMALRSHFGGL